MSIRMICGYIPVLTVTAVLSACGGNQVAEEASAAFAKPISGDSSYSQYTGQLSGRWLIKAIGDRAVDGAQSLVIAFDDHSRVGGIAGCNRFLGAYTLGGKGELALQELKVTRRICPDPVMMQERLLLNRLENVHSSRFTEEGGLLLFFDKREKPIRLSRDPESLVTSAVTYPEKPVSRHQG